MSVQSFIKQLFDSDLDFSNVAIDDFITCIKRLNQILTECADPSRRSARSRRYNSILAKTMGLNDKFNSRVSELYTFSADDVQIDICIRGKSYYVAISGSWRPSERALQNLLYIDNLNYDMLFDFSEVKVLGKDNQSFTYYGGSDFPVNNEGFKRILRLWSMAVYSYSSKLNDLVITDRLSDESSK